MGKGNLDPTEVIDLVSSDDEVPSTTNKRSREDDESLHGNESSLRDSKRTKTDPPETAEPELHGQEPSGDKSSGAEEGEIEEEEPQAPVIGSEAASNAQQQVPKQPSGWNPTISKTVVRTSLSKPTLPSAPPSAPASASSAPQVYQHGSLTFKLPDLSGKKEGSWLERFKEWVSVFQGANLELTHAIVPALVQQAYACYIDSFSGLKPKKRRSAKQASQELETNGTLAALLQKIQPTTNVTSQALPIDQSLKQSASKGTRKGKSSRASSVSEDRVIAHVDNESSESEAEYEPMLNKSEKNGEAIPSATEWASLLDNSTQANGNGTANAASQDGPISTKRSVPTGATALEQQRKYFPSATDASQICLLCGRGTHLAPNCPTLICSFCGSLEHPDLCCPGRVRCSKCRQIGHLKSQCGEKLALTSDEGLACSVCDSPDHLENDCTQVWRSFHPESDTIKKAVFIPATCAMCGSNQHFSADCKRRRRHVSNPTWSLKNCDQYIDAACEVSSIEGASAGHVTASTTGAPDLRIRGHATRTSHVHYSESDDSETEFLGHKPVQQRAHVGQIRMASNIQMPGNASRSNGQYQPPVQPPLPPGPPPPGPPSRQGSFGQPPPPGMAYAPRPSGPPPSLPARPPATRGYQNVPPPPNQQGFNGRPLGGNPPHGSRGGGRGRGGRGGRGGGGRGGGGGGGGRFRQKNRAK
ncbi:hypothetical protein B0T10DRAFT_9530 [Thelonectria olida]|uniref:CCHC-type domain-containing protein n=1 Tax=Thelonectria olida TaxID=1576542 RepID=A0A9P9AX56_9HYPO|nr:hypothetical protein B0T10DRAFT_9530 [Thelonectria olida]